MQQLIPLGIALVFIGIILLMAGLVTSSKDGKVHWGIGGFIGPTPFGFANNKNTLYTVAAISAILFVLFLLNSRFFFGS